MPTLETAMIVIHDIAPSIICDISAGPNFIFFARSEEKIRAADQSKVN
jgi:hypothetical protein